MHSLRLRMCSFAHLGTFTVLLSVVCKTEAFSTSFLPTVGRVLVGRGLASRSALHLRPGHARHFATMAANYKGAASPGDLAEVNWACTTADGKPLPADAQVFDQGRVRLVLGAGDFLPCLHANLAGMKQVVLFDTYHHTQTQAQTWQMQILSHHAPSPSPLSAFLSAQQGDKRSLDVAPSEAFGDANPMMGPVDVPRWGEERDRRALESEVRGCDAIAGWSSF